MADSPKYFAQAVCALLTDLASAPCSAVQSRGPGGSIAINPGAIPKLATDTHNHKKFLLISFSVLLPVDDAKHAESSASVASADSHQPSVGTAGRIGPDIPGPAAHDGAPLSLVDGLNRVPPFG